MSTKLAQYLTYGREKTAAPGSLRDTLGNWLGGHMVDLSKKTKPPPVLLDALREEAEQLAEQRARRKWLGRLYDTPNLHPQDLALGGTLGAAAGYGAGALIEDPEATDAKPFSRAALVGAGAVGGAAGTNAVGNAVRRYIANTSPLATYNVKNLKPFSFKDFINHGVLNKPVADEGGLAPRRELLRRYLNIHEPNAERDFFVRNRDGSLSFNPATTGAGTEFHQEYVRKPLRDPSLYGAFTRDVDAGGDYSPAFDKMKPPAYSNEPGPFFGIFGSHDTRPVDKKLTPAGGAEVVHEIGDTWNLAIDPHEKQELGTYLEGLAGSSPSAWGKFLQQPASAYEELKEPSTVGGRLPQYFLRQLTETGLRHHSPVIRQRVRLRYPKPVAIGSAPAEVARPAAFIEALPNESGVAAHNPLDVRTLGKGVGLTTGILGAGGVYGMTRGDKDNP